MQKEIDGNHHPATQFRIARPTGRLAEVVRFYTEGLQLNMLYSFEGHGGYSGAMIGLPGVNYHLEFIQDKKGTCGTAPTKENLLVLYFKSEDDLLKIRKSLESMGNHPVEPENPYWQDKSWTYEDPDGWRVVLYNGTFLM